ncbi:MAG: GNAT family N-acetyltransferase [Azospirillaceae bacterium]|nr:GNAT family N-acetyltransferase [Azospirillaceae bacterium]
MRTHSYELRAPASPSEWGDYHEIRKTCLFDVYHPRGSDNYFEYDANHPDERAPGNHPLVFLRDGRVIGTIRIDIKPDQRAIFRMIAIRRGLRGRALGTRLLCMGEAYARSMNAHAICLNSVAAAFKFYLRNGFNPFRWDGCTRCPTSVPVIKPLMSAA